MEHGKPSSNDLPLSTRRTVPEELLSLRVARM
jgi:hypothetical protein